MLSPRDLALGGVEIPPVDKEEVRQFWLKMQELQQEHPSEGVGFDLRLFQGSLHCDPLAVYARATLLLSLTLDGEISDAIYERAAEYPLPEGVRSFQPEEFLAGL